jgi:hypothetical protein
MTEPAAAISAGFARAVFMGPEVDHPSGVMAGRAQDRLIVLAGDGVGV